MNVIPSDGIDGKQARRTGSSGPLGELFDHGLDSYAAALVPICLYSCFGRYDHSISTWRMFLVLWNILVSFYLSHWEKYITGVLFLPWGYDFGMLVSLLLHITCRHILQTVTVYIHINKGRYKIKCADCCRATTKLHRLLKRLFILLWKAGTPVFYK